MPDDNTIERRFVPAASLRAERAEGVPSKITGYAAIFDSLSVDLGGFREQIKPGAFAETIKTADVRALVDHDPQRIIGRSKAKTLRLSEDNTGLHMGIDVADTTAGRDILASVERGDIDGASFAFRTIDDSWETKDGEEIRTLETVELIDVSPVTFPAYPDTAVAARSLEQYRKSTEPEPPEKTPNLDIMRTAIAFRKK